jgi:hypothetical protein
MPSIISKQPSDQSIHWFRIKPSDDFAENTRQRNDGQEHSEYRMQWLAKAEVRPEESYNDEHVA